MVLAELKTPISSLNPRYWQGNDCVSATVVYSISLTARNTKFRRKSASHLSAIRSSMV
jgi:hypothetical protein